MFLLILVWMIGGTVVFALDTSASMEGRRAGHHSDKPIMKLGTVPVIKLERDMAATPAEVA
jgi:hypothetical protein